MKVNHSGKINLFFAGLCRLIFQNDVQKFISRMHIVLIVCNLGAQCFRHLACFFCVLPVFHDKQVVFQVVVDGANPFFIFHFLLIVCKLLLKLCDLHLVPLFLRSEIHGVFRI